VLSKSTRISEDGSFTLHEWIEGDKLKELTATRINESIIAADNRKHGKQSEERGKNTSCVSNETCHIVRMSRE